MAETGSYLLETRCEARKRVMGVYGWRLYRKRAIVVRKRLLVVENE